MCCFVWQTIKNADTTFITITHRKIENRFKKSCVIKLLSVTWFILYSAGKRETEVKELDKVVYHDWRLIPKHAEQQFRNFEPLPEPPLRHVPYPPLLRAMLLAQHKKAYGQPMTDEPLLPLKKEVVLNKDYFLKQDQEKQRRDGTSVWDSAGVVKLRDILDSVLTEVTKSSVLTLPAQSWTQISSLLLSSGEIFCVC